MHLVVVGMDPRGVFGGLGLHRGSQWMRVVNVAEVRKLVG